MGQINRFKPSVFLCPYTELFHGFSFLLSCQELFYYIEGILLFSYKNITDFIGI
jgi:hypothetical protein